MSIATGIPPAQIPPRSRAARSSHGEGRKAYAALDLGTNNCRLLVAVPQDADEKPLYCGPVMRHPAAPLQAANFSSAI